eukprot:scaffold164269_cov12-Tisochrysis_lutea.AAC.1
MTSPEGASPCHLPHTSSVEASPSCIQSLLNCKPDTITGYASCALRPLPQSRQIGKLHPSCTPSAWA